MEKYYWTFDVFGQRVEFFGDSEMCLKNLNFYLTLPQIDKLDKLDLSVEVREVTSCDVDRRIPLPREIFKIGSYTIRANIEIQNRTYAREAIYWADYAGVGRIKLDFLQGKAQVLIIADNTVLPTYQKFLFIDFVLDRLLGARGIFSIHGSCASINGKGIAFTGSSGTGKSTAAYALLIRGYPVITDEKLFLFKRLGYVGGAITDIVKVRAEAVNRFFPELSINSPYDVIEKETYYQIGRTGYCWQAETPVDYLCMLEQTGQASTSIEGVSLAKMVGQLFPVTMSACIPFNRPNKFNFLMDFLNETPCYCIKFGTDMDDFVHSVENLTLST